VLVVSVKGRRIRNESVVPLNGNTWADLAETLSDQEVEVLVCGGISPTTRDSILSRDVEVVENVAGTRTEVLEALRRGGIRPGFGLGPSRRRAARADEGQEDPDPSRLEGRREADRTIPLDCLECRDRRCLQGEACPYLGPLPRSASDPETLKILESAWDVALEEERALCRIAELVYFALEMGYQRIGLAFCEDLREPADILTGVLRRFFQVHAVGCKLRSEPYVDPAGGSGDPHGSPSVGGVPCDPRGVAAILNARNTELNVVVGFCVGADCIFHRNSHAPVTTIFLKDKSLANNPIGAVYSHYYLEDI
jgi:uncharacterized metal-binding protein